MSDASTEQNSIALIRRAMEDVEANAHYLQLETVRQVKLALEASLQKAKDLQAATTASVDEIRLVTVVFVDVVGSTRIAENLTDDEAWRALISETHSEFVSVLQRWDGEVGQFLGDGLLCYFGARRSRGNDALRAVSFALALQDAMADFSLFVKEKYSTEAYSLNDFRVRIGVSTGRAIVGPIGEQGQEQILTIGTTTNLAARLQNVAPPGGTAIDDETYLRIRTEFEIAEQPAVRMNGFEEPIPYYLVKSARRQTATQLASERIEGISIPFVGRHDIYQKILLQMQQIRDAESFSAVTLYGEIGVGKSRILQEVARASLVLGFKVVRMVGHYEQKEVAFSLLRDMLATVCDLSPTATSAENERQIVDFTKEHIAEDDAVAAATVVGYLAGYGFKDSSYATSLHKSVINRENRLAFRWVMRWLLGYTDDVPLLILVDNLQWADSQSIAMLEYLSHVDHPMMIVTGVTTASDEPQIEYLQEQPNHVQIATPPLEREQTGRLLRSVFQHVENIPEDLPHLIIERSRGNPLYVEEFLRMLFDNGVFQRISDTRWRVNSFNYQMVKGQLPNGLMGVFQARLDDLPSEMRRVVQIASVLGQAFWAECITHVAGFDVSTILSDLTRRNITVRRPQTRVEGSREYMFRNNLYFEVAYAMLPRVQRVDYHRRTAEWLQQRTVDNSHLLGLLGEQYNKGGQVVAALEAYIEATRHKLLLGNLGEAQALVSDGLAASQKLARSDALPSVSQLWLLQARVAYLRHHYQEATAATQSALMLLDELPDDQMGKERVTAHVILANAHTSLGNYEGALEALTRVYLYVDTSKSSQQLATVQQALGMLFWSRGNLDQADMYLRSAYTTAEESDSTQTMMAAVSFLGRVALDKGDFATSLDYMERVLEANDETDNILHQISDLRLIALIYRLLLAYEMSLDMIKRAEQLSATINYHDPLLQANRALCEIALGRQEEGMARMRKMIGQDYDNKYEYQVMQLTYVRSLIQVGDYAMGWRTVKRYLDDVGESNRVLQARGLLWSGLAGHQMGHPGWLESLHQSLEYESTYGGQSLWLCHYALGTTHPDEGQAAHHRERARQILSAISASLYRRPDLASIVTNPKRIAGVFANLTNDSKRTY